MRKQDIPDPNNLPICQANKEDCICDQLIYCQPGEIIKVRGDFTPDSSPCVRRFTKTVIKSQGFKWKRWPEPRPHQTADEIDSMYDEEYILSVLNWGLTKALSAGVVTKRQHFFITKLIEKIVPFYVEVYMHGRDIGHEFAMDDSFISQEEFEGLTGMGDKQ